ncbi:hypothetical protein GCM10009650_15930 [Nesterenkonia jeotgali]
MLAVVLRWLPIGSGLLAIVLRRLPIGSGLLAIVLRRLPIGSGLLAIVLRRLPIGSGLLNGLLGRGAQVIGARVVRVLPIGVLWRLSHRIPVQFCEVIGLGVNKVALRRSRSRRARAATS